MSNGFLQNHGTKEALLASHKTEVDKLRAYAAGKPSDYDNAFVLIDNVRRALGEIQSELLQRYSADVECDISGFERGALEQYAKRTMNRVQQCIADGSFFPGVGNAFAHADEVLKEAEEAGVKVDVLSRQLASMKKSMRILS